MDAGSDLPWRRLPGFGDVSAATWADARWQRVNSVRDVRGLKRVFGHFLDDELAADLVRDQERHATMPLFIPPHMLATMNERDLWGDPVRRYMAPACSERDPVWPSHPFAARDSLHERDMWAVEGLTHRYPQKVLAELVTTCPQYCGHCTRMDLVGQSTPQVPKHRFAAGLRERTAAMLTYLRSRPEVTDVVVSGGDIANVPIAWLEEFVGALVELPQIRDVRLATKALVALPQHFLQPDVLAGFERIAVKAREWDVDVAVHTHANHAQQITPQTTAVVRHLLDMGFRDVRNQAVLLRGVNDSPAAQVELARTLLHDGRITPYYVYMCDIVPGCEHWRTSLATAQELQQAIMGYLPGYATPRVVCDVPLLGKKWVHQVDEYDVRRGVSYWSKRYEATCLPADAAVGPLVYYDPIHSLGPDGREWWEEHGAAGLAKAR